ncbi:MAG TPA: phosphoribosylamine--glycine ligase [Ignavibacteria bacterium]
MNILIVGNSGRENAIAYQIYHSESFRKNHSKLFCTYPTPGISLFAESVDIQPSDTIGLVKFCIENKIDYTIVGPEIPLSLGIVNEFEKNNLKIFGPVKEAAEIETSKVFSKKLMEKYNIPTASYKSFDSDNYEECFNFAEKSRFPLVVKADGLAAGKGVVIVNDLEELKNAIKEFTEDKIFGESGCSFVLEEFLNGYELSIFAVTDGEDYVLLPFAQDHKKIGERDTGKNTGGMGAYAPADFLVDDILKEKIKSGIISPVLFALKKENRKYKGCLYCGLMIVENSNGNKSPFVIEFNCRFGDPETQAVLPLLKSDFLALLISSVEGNIRNYIMDIYQDFNCCVVLASGGYPDKYETGKIITGLTDIDTDCLVFHSGTKLVDGNIITNGGRVLSIISKGKSLKEAADKCYLNIGHINFEKMYFRRDIAMKGLLK